MGRRVEGDDGGIRGLRQLIEGEHAGAINTDLRRHHYPGVEWAGTIHLSWWELKHFLEYLQHDQGSALARRVDPDGAGWDLQSQLLAEIATHTSAIRHMTAVPVLGEGMPADWGASMYGPKAKMAAPAKRGKSVEEKKAIAARARARAAGKL